MSLCILDFGGSSGARATTVVLLHGLMGEMDHWESALETLGAFCRPIALELPLFDAGLVDVGAGPGRLRAALHGGARAPAIDHRRQFARRPRRARARAGPARMGRGADPHRLVGTLRADLHPQGAAPADRRVRAGEDGGDLLRPDPGHTGVGRVGPPHRHHLRASRCACLRGARRQATQCRRAAG